MDGEMIFFLLTALVLSNLNTHAEAEISSAWSGAGGGGWGALHNSQLLDEAADEVKDAEILQAVITSMKEWNEKHNRTRVKRSQGNRVCYDQLGCFEDSGPFGYLEMLPSPPQEINTRFLLYSTKSRGDIPLLDVPFGNLTAAWRWADRAFNTSSPTKVIVHGFGSNCDHVWVYEMRSALMAVEECNVICVDWEAGAIVPNYVRAAANTRLVGKQLAMLLEGLADHINLSFDKVHLIGFSLGAHVAGFAGSQLKNISRITGLDPAGPLFEAQDPRARLDSNDAMFVDVIHSNGENLILGGLGSWQPMGHVDFYPNGGRMQTGCSNLFVGAVSDIIWSSANEGRSLCNHRRAYKFFTDSVSPKCHFPSFPCETYDDFLAGRCFGCDGGRRCGNMGYYADRANGRGQMYLLTREEEPFCAHQYYVRVESSKSNQTVVSYGRILLTLVGDSALNETFPLTRKDDAELTRGGILSRMLVPHPALGIPVKVQLQYQAYSGWISSGLNRWTIDKVLLSDSFGKSSSICKRGLILNSGAPVTLRLYPGDCNHPKTADDQNENAPSELDSSEKNVEESNTLIQPFIPTQVVQIGDEIIQPTDSSSISTSKEKLTKREDVLGANLKGKLKNNLSKDKPGPESEGGRTRVIPMGNHFRIEAENKTSDPLLSLLDAADILNLPWQPLLANSLDNSPNERESGRAFGSINKKYNGFTFFESKRTNPPSHTEIVEPILKVPSAKNARSHDGNKVKKEITEPILGSTTARPKQITTGSSFKTTNARTNRAQKPYEFSSRGETKLIDRIDNTENKTVWTPSHNLIPPETEDANIWEQILKINSSLASGNQSKYVNDTQDVQTTLGDETFSLFQWQSREKKEIAQSKNPDSFTVQFLPSRLVSFLEKAEKYARNTLLPLVSAYTPRFLFFGKNLEPTEVVIKETQKYVPLEESDTDSDSMPVLEQTQQQKMDLIHNMGPPDTSASDSSNSGQMEVHPTQGTNSESTTPAGLLSLSSNDESETSQSDPIKIVKAPTMTTTTLPPKTMQSRDNSSEKIIIVYPSNTRDDRKIQSQTFPEIMQFESLYQQSVNSQQGARSAKNDLEVSPSQHYEEKADDDYVRIDLPTYEPPTATSPYSYKKPNSKTPTPNFIPVSYPSDIRSNA